MGLEGTSLGKFIVLLVVERSSLDMEADSYEYVGGLSLVRRKTVISMQDEPH